MKASKQKKRSKGCLKYIGIFFCVFTVLLVVLTIIASHTMKNAMKGIEKPQRFRAYEELQQLREATEATAVVQQETLPETTVMQEVWQADLSTLESRFMAFAEITKELQKIQAADQETFWKAFWERDYSSSDYTEEERAAFIAYFQGKKDFLKKIQAFIVQGGPVYPLKVEDGITMELPHLAQVRELTRWLSYAAVAEAYAGNYEQAFDYIQSAFRCGALVKDEPVLISYLVDNACNGIALWNLCEAFPPGTLTPQQSNTIIRLARKHNAQPRGIEAIKHESYLILPLFEDPGRFSSENVGQHFFGSSFNTMGNNHPVQQVLANLYRTPFSAPVRHMNYTKIVEINEEIYTLSQQPYYAALEASETLAQKIENLAVTYQLAKDFTGALTRVSGAQARMEAQFDLLWMGLTLEQFFVENGVYPGFIENAIPDAPLDPFSGDPYVYESTGDDFLLYSLGSDFEDDGGRHGFREFDIVWRNRNEPTHEELKAERKKSRVQKNLPK